MPPLCPPRLSGWLQDGCSPPESRDGAPSAEEVEAARARAAGAPPLRIAFVIVVHGRAVQQVLDLLELIYDPKHHYLVHVDAAAQFMHHALSAALSGECERRGRGWMGAGGDHHGRTAKRIHDGLALQHGVGLGQTLRSVRDPHPSHLAASCTVGVYRQLGTDG